MKLANIFPKQALAPVLTAALSVVSLFGVASNGNAEPAKVTTVSAPVPNTVSIPSPNTQIEPGSPVQKKVGAAYDHSLIGPSVVILINEKENPSKYKADVDAILEAAKLNNVPLKVFGFRTTDPSSVHIILDRIVFTKHGSGADYSTDRLRAVGGAAMVLYGQSQEYKAQRGINTSAAESVPDIASNIR